MNKGASVRHNQIGIDRIVRLEWLQRTARLSQLGENDQIIKQILQEDLSGYFHSPDPSVRGSLDKTITILLKVWVRVPQELEALKSTGLSLLNTLPQREQLGVHWGMIMAVYPFWASVSSQIGRLLRLQGSAVAVQVQRRTRELYGERETVSRRTRYVIRSLIAWGVVVEANKKGVYSSVPGIKIESHELMAWLIEAALHASPDNSAPVKDLIGHPALFPFEIDSIDAQRALSSASGIEIVRHGLDQDLVVLK